MCGIFGFNFDDKAVLELMNKKLIHRGPDDYAKYFDKNISLGMRRLSIIDLKKGIYPVKNEKEDIIAIFNGELYNFKEIKFKLIEKGHKFITNCDAEIIPHAYEEYGLKFIEKINGQFAICIYDKNKKKLFLIRDRLGIKPLYYYFDKKNNKFSFSSEIKTILEFPYYEKSINKVSLNNYFTYRYTPGNLTLFDEIKKVLPGHILTYDWKDVKLQNFWDFDFNYNDNSIEQNAKILLKLFEESVQKRLMSDVPLGCYLSGGIDSSAIVSMMKKYTQNVNTFNVSFSEKQYDESKFATLVAKEFNTNHKQIDVDIDAVKVLPKVVYHLDEPIADAATIPTYLMSIATKKVATVVLSGEGSDEIFGGYERFRHLSFASKLRNIPSVFRKLPSQIIDKENIMIKRGSKLLENIHDKESAYLSYYSVFDEEEKSLLYNKDTIKKSSYDLEKYFSSGFIEGVLKTDIKETLPNNMLLKNDKMTMAASLEARVPFLDHKLVEFSTTIPVEQKVSLNKEKIVLKKALKNNLPKEITQRRKKGFSLPTSKWVKEGLNDHLQVLIKENNEPYLNKNYIDKISSKVDQHYYYERQFWSVLMYEQWYNEFMRDN
jgi:asparagine synthase (glutamine-hydrolysing)